MSRVNLAQKVRVNAIKLVGKGGPAAAAKTVGAVDGGDGGGVSEAADVRVEQRRHIGTVAAADGAAVGEFASWLEPCNSLVIQMSSSQTRWC